MSIPITPADMAAAVQRAVNRSLPGIAEAPDGSTFEMTAPATSQRFRVTVEEIPGWSDRMDAELNEITGKAVA